MQKEITDGDKLKNKQLGIAVEERLWHLLWHCKGQAAKGGGLGILRLEI